MGLCIIIKSLHPILFTYMVTSSNISISFKDEALIYLLWKIFLLIICLNFFLYSSCLKLISLGKGFTILSLLAPPKLLELPLSLVLLGGGSNFFLTILFFLCSLSVVKKSNENLKENNGEMRVVVERLIVNL